LSVYYQLINLELTRNNLPGVKKYVNKGLSIDPNDGILFALYGEYYYRLGLNYAEKQEFREAKEEFEESVRIWQKTKTKTNDPKWIQYAQKGIINAQKNIKEVEQGIW